MACKNYAVSDFEVHVLKCPFFRKIMAMNKKNAEMKHCSTKQIARSFYILHNQNSITNVVFPRFTGFWNDHFCDHVAQMLQHGYTKTTGGRPK